MKDHLEKRMTRDQLVTIGDLEQLKAELIETMKQLLKSGSLASPKPWLKSDEVRKLLGISAGKLLTLRVNGILPYTRIGNVIYYKTEDIRQLFEPHKTPSRFTIGGLYARHPFAAHFVRPPPATPGLSFLILPSAGAPGPT